MTTPNFQVDVSFDRVIHLEGEISDATTTMINALTALSQTVPYIDDDTTRQSCLRTMNEINEWIKRNVDTNC